MMFLPTLYSTKSQLQARLKSRQGNGELYVAENMLDRICLDCIEYCIKDIAEKEKLQKLNSEIDTAIARILSERRCLNAENPVG